MNIKVGLLFMQYFFLIPSVFAEENSVGIMASNGCVNCHGYEGRASAYGNIPSLQGRSKKFLVTAMQGYKEGTLHGTVMNRIIEDFDQSKIEILADYFSGIK